MIHEAVGCWVFTAYDRMGEHFKVSAPISFDEKFSLKTWEALSFIEGLSDKKVTTTRPSADHHN